MGAKASMPNWRTGKFHDDNDEDQYYTEQNYIDESGGTFANQQLSAQLNIEEKVLSKHAARRQRKKGKGGGVVVNDYPEEGQPIMGQSEPSLDDL
jgi:hypothetical protein